MSRQGPRSSGCAGANCARGQRNQSQQPAAKTRDRRRTAAALGHAERNARPYRSRHFCGSPNLPPMPLTNCARRCRLSAPRRNWPCAVRGEKPNIRNRCATFCSRPSAPRVLIEQLLSLARADSGRETLQHAARRFAADVAQRCRRLAAGRRHSQPAVFRRALTHRTLLSWAMRLLLRRLADILLDNAFKYTPSPGSVRLSLEPQEESAVITVQDSGVGIAEEEQSKIFERFYRVDKARSRAAGRHRTWPRHRAVDRHATSRLDHGRKPPGRGRHLPRGTAHDRGAGAESAAGCRRMFKIPQPLPYNGKAFHAGMAELADAADSKSADLRVLGVRLPLPAPP